RPTRYPGNYDQYRALAAEAAAAAAAPVAPIFSQPKISSPPTKSAPARSEKEKPLTYAERIELEGLLDKVGAAEEAAAALEARLADPALYAGGAKLDEARRLESELAAAKAEVARVTARWEELEARPKK